MHLVDEIVLLEDVEQDPADYWHLEDPHEDLHQKAGDPRSWSTEFRIQNSAARREEDEQSH